MISQQWRVELVFITALARVNQEIGHYVLRALDADAGRTQPTSPDDERALGRQLTALGQQLQERADQRLAEAGHPVVDGTTDES